MCLDYIDKRRPASEGYQVVLNEGTLTKPVLCSSMRGNRKIQPRRRWLFASMYSSCYGDVEWAVNESYVPDWHVFERLDDAILWASQDPRAVIVKCKLRGRKVAGRQVIVTFIGGTGYTRVYYAPITVAEEKLIERIVWTQSAGHVEN